MYTYACIHAEGTDINVHIQPCDRKGGGNPGGVANSGGLGLRMGVGVRGRTSGSLLRSVPPGG